MRHHRASGSSGGRRTAAATAVVVRASSSAAPTSTFTSSSGGGDGGPAFAEATDLDDAATAAERELKMNVKPYLDANPGLVYSRVLRIASSAVYVALKWMSNDTRRGAILRDAVAELGPVFVKLGKEAGGRDVPGRVMGVKGHKFRRSFYPTSRVSLILRFFLLN